MIFNSNAFLFAFLPMVFIGFYLIRRYNYWMAIGFLAIASLLFYAVWNVKYLPLLLGSILINFAFGRFLVKHPTRLLITAGVMINLGLLGYFKYANFFVETTNQVLASNVNLTPIALPLAISFFTFQQIAYLVDVFRGEARAASFMHYVLFVGFFPQLIAGPIVHHKEMMDQFARAAKARFSSHDIALGLTLISFGLFKKVFIADQVAAYADPVFRRAEIGDPLTFFTAWGGALSYHFQIYFDFSGYSDMALGLACLFGIRLPVNFYSPYKARNIIEFWRRWNMTLSRFLRDYLYYPLGGNRHGMTRRYLNLLATMLLGGLWHGAAWNFVIWGGLHGIFLVVNHSWHALSRMLGRNPRDCTIGGRATGTLLTFIAVVIAWVFFRAESLNGAQNMLSGMFGVNGVSIPDAVLSGLGPVGGTLLDLGVTTTASGALNFATTYIWIITLLAMVWLLPNSVQVLAKYRPALNLGDITPDQSLVERRNGMIWSWTPVHAIAVGVLGFISFKLINAGAPSTFIYFIF